MSQASQISPAGLLARYTGGHQHTSAALADIHRASQAAALELIASVLPGQPVPLAFLHRLLTFQYVPIQLFHEGILHQKLKMHQHNKS